MRDHDGVLEALEWAQVFLAPSVSARSGDQERIPNVVKEAMGRAGRERIEAEYDSDGLNERLLELYREVLSGLEAD